MLHNLPIAISLLYYEEPIHGIPTRLDEVLSVPYLVMAVGLALLTGTVVLTAERLVPWTTDSVPVS